MYTATDRERQRYVRFTGKNPLPTFSKLFGSYGEARAGVQLHATDVIRVNAEAVDHIKAAICLTPGCRSIAVTSSITKART